MSSRRSARLTAIAESAGVKAAELVPPTASVARPRKRKAAPKDPEPESAPVTPPRRRARKETTQLPATPTPKAAGLIAESVHENGLTPPRKPKSAAVNRLADPNRTNAPLFSPETSRIIAPKLAAAVSPSKLPGVRTTAANLLEEACAHLIKVDARMKPLVEAHHCRIFSPEGLAEEVDPFEALTSGIISQQVSGAAAKSIKARFVVLFDDRSDGESTTTATAAPSEDIVSSGPRFPQPSQVAATPIETLRTAGLSQRKAEYVQGLAEKFASGELSAHLLADAPYGEVLEKLIAVRGLGRWSVEMFACFALKRMDVFSVGDLGVQRGMAAFVGRDVAKLKGKGGKWKYMSEKEMEEISERFRPYRSLFMWYMWRVEETDVSTME